MMYPREGFTLERFTLWAMLAGVAAGLVLFAVRAYFAISFTEPLQLTTGGAEEETFYAVWKLINGRDVYTDPNRIPFAASYYNWLFFETYGRLAGAALRLFGLGDAWIPTVLRLFTLAVCIFGVGVLYRSLVLIAAPPAGLARTLAAAFAVNFFFGPLAGFWTIAANVEFIASLLLMLSLYLFCGLYERRPVAAMVAFVVLAYAAWAMKQNYVFSAGAVGLFVLMRRDWISLAVLVVLLPAAWAATLWLGSEPYVKLAFFTDTDLTFSAQRLMHNLGNMASKSLSLLFGIVAVGVVMVRAPTFRRRIVAHRWFALFAAGLGVALVIAVPPSGFVGASENHYFVIVYFLTVLLVIALAALWPEPAARRPVLAALAVGWMLNVAAVGTVLAGYAGVLSNRDRHDRYMEIKRCLEVLPRPAFIPNVYNMLPWMYPAEQHFVIAYNYFRDRKTGRRFERGGIGGLIREDYFAALVLNAKDGAFDGARLAGRYVRTGRCAGLDVWVRQP